MFSDDGEDLEDTEKEKTEPPAPIPMIGDTKTGPLSLIAGQDSRKEPVKKTRVGYRLKVFRVDPVCKVPSELLHIHCCNHLCNSVP